MPQFDSPTQTPDRVRPFRLAERRIWPGCVEIEIEGELDFVVCGRLRDALDAARADGCHVLLGFGACSFIDSGGLAVIVAGRRALAERDRQLLLYGVRGQVRRVLSVTGLTENGMPAPAGANEARPAEAEAGPEAAQSFQVTVAGGRSVRLTAAGGARA